MLPKIKELQEKEKKIAEEKNKMKLIRENEEKDKLINKTSNIEKIISDAPICSDKIKIWDIEVFNDDIYKELIRIKM